MQITTPPTDEPQDFHDCHPYLEESALENSQILPLHTISNNVVGEMMRMKGYINGLEIKVFIDCGAASNFLNPTVAVRLGLEILPPPHHQFTAASGHSLTPSGLVTNITVEMQGYKYTNSFLLLPVAGCDLVLGAQWLDSLGFIGWHYFDKVMMFVANGQQHVLQGLSSKSPALDDPTLMSFLPSDHVELIAQLIPSTSTPTISHHCPEITSLLHQFSTLFEPPSSLPPSRPTDHRIPLLPNTTPINVRPYRYAHSQKTELESQVNDMLSTGLIRPSCSPYSSPVLLVRKKERSWRFCVDYRALNVAMVKDRFPIPIVDELLDELHGASCFTKLNLRSGYHQIRMVEEDIPKTAFRTHDGD